MQEVAAEAAEAVVEVELRLWDLLRLLLVQMVVLEPRLQLQELLRRMQVEAVAVEHQLVV
jgi:hypothetical protein